ncbi:MAG TPA: hypothetical protein VGF61_22815, partial [Candidatus Acidoferrum sp.]
VDGSYPIIATSYLTSTFLPELIDGFGEHFLKASQNHCRMVSPAPLRHLSPCVTSTEQLLRQRYDCTNQISKPMRQPRSLQTD